MAERITFKDVRHIVRVAVIIAVVMVGFLVARGLTVPKSFGQYGHYRGESIQERQSLPAILENPETCRECHEDELKHEAGEDAIWPGLDAWKKGKHGALTCANCHDNLKEHIERQQMDPAPTEFVVTKDMRPQLCLLCHHEMAARPAVLPIFSLTEQDHVNYMEVLKEELDEIVGCNICHPTYRPHDPKLTE